MKLIRGNIWDSKALAICVTTNGNVRSDGRAVMGRGIALQAAQRYPQLPFDLAERLNRFGNKVHSFYAYPSIITFPTKNDWRNPSDLGLIALSATQLVELRKDHDGRVALPFPGCANGGLDIDTVLAIIDPILSDDKFEIWDYKVKP